MTEQEIIQAYNVIKKSQLTIPSNVIEYMKEAAIEKLKNRAISKCDICGEAAYYMKTSGQFCHEHRNN